MQIYSAQTFTFHINNEILLTYLRINSNRCGLFSLLCQEAEKMVAYLHDGGGDDERLGTKNAERPKVGCLPPSHEAALKWYYKDPQGEIQGKNQHCKIMYPLLLLTFQ